ncbi:MAG: hypothetical protein VCF07_04255 [Nitrospinota bacterium]
MVLFSVKKPWRIAKRTERRLSGTNWTRSPLFMALQKRKVKCVFFAVKSPAGSGVMGEDYQAVDNAEELVRMVDEKVAEIRAAEASGG